MKHLDYLIIEHPKWGNVTELDSYTWNDIKETLKTMRHKYNGDDHKTKMHYEESYSLSKTVYSSYLDEQ